MLRKSKEIFFFVYGVTFSPVFGCQKVIFFFEKYSFLLSKSDFFFLLRGVTPYIGFHFWCQTAPNSVFYNLQKLNKTRITLCAVLTYFLGQNTVGKHHLNLLIWNVVFYVICFYEPADKHFYMSSQFFVFWTDFLAPNST